MKFRDPKTGKVFDSIYISFKNFCYSRLCEDGGKLCAIGYGGGSSTATHGYTLDDRKIEIIGNRWDNPELLKEAGGNA